jgi:hypothetical protein
MGPAGCHRLSWRAARQPATRPRSARPIEAADVGCAPTLKAVLADLHGDKKRALGNLLRDVRGRVLDRRKLERTDHKRPKWRVVNMGAGASAPSGDPKPLVDTPDVPALPNALT